MRNAIFTIGFTEKSAEKFFSLIESSGVTRLIDVRLNTKSQLAGFAKQGDLRYFLRKICNVEYIHNEALTPTKSLLDAYKKSKSMTWENYEYEFRNLMAKRQIEKKFRPEDFHDACLLCSENKPHHCHRRVVAEYFKEHWNVPMEIKHLV